VPDESLLVRLQRLRALGELGEAAGQLAADDSEIAKSGKASVALAQAEREKVALLGAEGPVVAELLGSKDPSGKSATATTSGVGVYWALSPAKRCVGVYVIGAQRGARVLNDATHAITTARILSQTFGHQVNLPDPPPKVGTVSPTSSTWLEGGTAIM